jgi:hypothetical protein
MGYTRKYRYKGGNQGAEQKRFWLLILVGLLIGAGIIYFF